MTDDRSSNGGETCASARPDQNLIDQAAHLFDLPLNPLKASIKAITFGTGFGKTFRGHLGAAKHLIDAKEQGRSLIILYGAPLNSQLEIEPKARDWLQAYNIPVVYNRSDEELKKFDNPLGLYQLLLRLKASAKNGLIDDMCQRVKRYAKDSELIDDDTYIDDAGSFQPTERTDVGVARQVILYALHRIKRMAERLETALAEDQVELENKLMESSNSLVFMTRKVVQALLSHNDRPVRHREAFKELVDALCPWFTVQQQGVGLISLTTSKMLYQQGVVKPHRNNPIRHQFVSLPLAQIIHEPGDLLGLANTEYLLLLDEADEAKSFFENHLSGALVKGAHITQALGALYREVERFVYRQGDEYRAVQQCIDNGGETASQALLDDFVALRNCRERIFRDMHPYRQANNRPLDSKTIAHILKDLQNVLYLTVKKDDPGVQSLGAAGLFTQGVFGFLNGRRLDKFALNQYASREVLIESANKDTHTKPLENTLSQLPLVNWFEVICEALMLVKEINNPTQYKDLRRPIRSPELPDDFHTAPLTSMLRKLSVKTTDDIFNVRRVYEPGDFLSIPFAFQSPQVCYALRRADKGEQNHSLSDRFTGVVPEVTYRLCSAEHFLERLINPAAYFKFKNEPDPGDTPRRHHAFLISATGGFKRNHVGGFVPAYFERSEWVDYREMNRIDLDLARQLQSESVQKRPARVLALDKQTRYDAPLLQEFKRFELKQEIKALNNPHKQRELDRALSVVDAMGGHTQVVLGHGEKNKEMRQALADQVRCALLITQTVSHIRKTFVELVNRSQKARYRSAVHEYARNVLYRVAGASGKSATMVVFYDKNTDKSLSQLRESVRRDIFRAMGLRRSSKDPITVATLLTKQASCKVLLLSAWRSASRGLNFICDTETPSVENSDLDALVVAMPSFYSKVYQPTHATNPSRALEHQIQTSHRIYEFAALEGRDVPRLEQLSVNAEHHFAGAKAFLDEQHRIQQTIDCIQCVGRAERTRPDNPVQQFLFINEESLSSYCDAEQMLFKDQPELHQCLSALNTRVLAFAKAYQLAQAYTLDDPITAEDEQAQALQCFKDTKDDYLARIHQLQQSALAESEALGLIEQWELWHSPRMLFEPEFALQSLRQAGWPEPFIRSLTLPRPYDGRHYVHHPDSFERLLFDKDEITQIAQERGLTSYDPEAIVNTFRVPHSMISHMEQTYGGDLRQVMANSETDTCWRPHMSADLKGFWGEWVCLAWIAQHFPNGQRLDLSRAPALLERFDAYLDVDAGEKRILLALDAKHWTKQTDLHHPNITAESAKEKYQELSVIAANLGFDDAIAVYFNSRPQIAEYQRAYHLDERQRVLAITGIQHVRDIDIVQPENDELYHPLADERLIVNQDAVKRLRSALERIAHEE